MTDRPLHRCRILVVEDEYLLADEITLKLEDEGAVVLGPAPSVERAMALLEGPVPDGAVLDVNLGGEEAFPVADVLIARGVPVIFTTGYDANTLPERFVHVPKCEKPINIGRVTAALCEAMHVDA